MLTRRGDLTVQKCRLFVNVNKVEHVNAGDKVVKLIMLLIIYLGKFSTFLELKNAFCA